jgi:hypothetical protein
VTGRDRWEPKLRVAASGYSGSGYRIPTRQGPDGKALLVAGVTTALGAIDKPGVLQWSIDNVSAYAVANVDSLLNRTEEQGYGFLRWYHKRMKESDFDDPSVDIRDYSSGVLNDLAELGTVTHDWVADFVNNYFEPDLVRPEQEEMAAEFVDWWNANDVEVIDTEVTVVGDGFAGTLDHLWRVNGVPTLVDLKTSRRTRDEHFAQLAALGAAESVMREVDEYTPGAVEYETKRWGKTYWIEEPLPDFSQYAILHLRPSDTDSHGAYMEPFCHFKVIDHDIIDSAYEMFRGALQVRQAQARLKALQKGK